MCIDWYSFPLFLLLTHKGISHVKTGYNCCIFYSISCLTWQGRQCMCNVTWRCLRWPLLQGTRNKYYIFWVCVHGLSYTTCNVHALYDIVISGPSGSTKISTSSHKLQDFQKNVCFDFYYNCCLKHFSFQEKFSKLLS